ncbi:MAG: methyltransferase [Planctomycetota bacterium]
MLTVDCGGIEVTHAKHLDGGGPRTWPLFVEAVRTRMDRVGHAFEWCAGPGYIGFALLGSGLCDRLTLADVNPDAVEAARMTVRQNGLEDRVSVYLSDNLRSIPESEQWDFVVADPPHFPKPLERHIRDGYVLRSVDYDFALHREFFATVRQHLNPGARLLIGESLRAGEEHQPFFRQLMADNGFAPLEEPIRWEHMTRYVFFIEMLEAAKAEATQGEVMADAT